MVINAGFLGANHFHHGILTSTDPYTVVDFSGRSISDAKITSKDLTFFMNNQTSLFRVNHKNRLVGSESAKRAVELVHNNKNNHKWGEYNIFTNSCKHFAIYCVRGETCSEQVSKLVDASLGKLIKDVVATEMDI